MSKSEIKTEKQLPLRSLRDSLLVAALGHVAYTLKPYPDSAPAADIAAAVADLRQCKLVHGGDRTPNLTAAGVSAAKTLKGS